MSRYHRLNVNEREEIALGLAQGRSQHEHRCFAWPIP